MSQTHLLYLKDFNLLNCEAKISDIFSENEKMVIVLNQTCFYPQGGGQPYDQGTIESPPGKFVVEEVRYADGIVRHVGKFEKGSLKKGDVVQCSVNKERRELNSKLHSAGHAVDCAVSELNLNWIPGKGYHFPDGPYVEYAGELEESNKKRLRTEVENLCNKFIEKGKETKIEFVNKNEMKKICRFVPDNIPEGKPGRVVMFGNFGVPCGGTHVKNLREINKLIIRKIKQDKGIIRVSYNVEK